MTLMEEKGAYNVF